jgi:hypothetical protein
MTKTFSDCQRKNDKDTYRSLGEEMILGAFR